MPSQQVPMGKPGEEVDAKDINIGDLIYFPNSRHPQEVTRLDKVGNSTRLSAEHVSMFVTEGQTVRKAVAE